MKRNPYEEAAVIEKEILKLQTNLRKMEQRAEQVVGRLKTIDPRNPRTGQLRNELAGWETGIARARQKLRRAISAKRQKEREGRGLQFGNHRNQKIRRQLAREITQELREQKQLLRSLRDVEKLFDADPGPDALEYDLFISHASEDKETLVRPLADALIEHGITVWYDDFSLTIGDSLRRSIDLGLSNSLFGLVVLSSDFFSKNWTQYELNSLVAREMEGAKVILPIWHKVTKDDVMRYSPFLVDKVALNTSLLSISEIASRIADAIRPDARRSR